MLAAVSTHFQQPLDFTAVPYHAEFFGPISLCKGGSSRLAYWFPACIGTRNEIFLIQLLAANYWVSLGITDTSQLKKQAFMCTLDDCDTAHKAAGECRFDRLLGQGVATKDELCDFEQVQSDNLSILGTLFGEVRTDDANPVSIDDFAPGNRVRNTLKDGLVLQRSTSINPFKLGFIGSTHTHSATPGGQTHKRIFDMAGSPDSDASVAVYSQCCLDSATQPFYSPKLQKRAWTSSIWINPTAMYVVAT